MDEGARRTVLWVRLTIGILWIFLCGGCAIQFGSIGLPVGATLFMFLLGLAIGLGLLIPIWRALSRGDRK